MIKENSLKIEISYESTRSLHVANFSYGNTTKMLELEAGLRLIKEMLLTVVKQC